MYDQACYDLAKSFLDSAPLGDTVTEVEYAELAQRIQDAIEGYLGELEEADS